MFTLAGARPRCFLDPSPWAPKLDLSTSADHLSFNVARGSLWRGMGM